MAKRRKPKRLKHSDHARPYRPPQYLAAADSATARIDTMDCLRGLAIVLMVVDHIAGLMFDLKIQQSSLRLATRLSMPLFCVLMGYFLDASRRYQWRRPAQVVVAAVFANAVFWPHYDRLEILGSLFLGYVGFALTGQLFVGFAAAMFLYPFDPTPSVLDFPLTIVFSFVAQGMILRRFGIGIALVTAVVLSSGAYWIAELQPGGVNHKLCLFILPATILVYGAKLQPKVSLPGINWIGRHPLGTYVTQYYVIFLAYYISKWLERAN